MLAAPFGNIDPSSFLQPGYLGGGGGLAAFIQNAVGAFFLVSGLGAFAFLLMGGFRYLTAGGDTKATEAAVKMITNAVIGLAIIMGAFGLTRILSTLFGIDILHPIFKGP